MEFIFFSSSDNNGSRADDSNDDNTHQQDKRALLKLLHSEMWISPTSFLPGVKVNEHFQRGVTTVINNLHAACRFFYFHGLSVRIKVLFSLQLADLCSVSEQLITFYTWLFSSGAAERINRLLRAKTLLTLFLPGLIDMKRCRYYRDSLYVSVINYEQNLIRLGVFFIERQIKMWSWSEKRRLIPKWDWWEENFEFILINALFWDVKKSSI